MHNGNIKSVLPLHDKRKQHGTDSSPAREVAITVDGGRQALGMEIATAQPTAQAARGAARLRDQYLVKSIVHCSKILSSFRSAGEALALKEIVQRSGLSKTMCFRLLYTLEKCGMVEKVSTNLYQSIVRPAKQRLCKLGYAAQGTNYRFSREVSESLERGAGRGHRTHRP